MFLKSHFGKLTKFEISCKIQLTGKKSAKKVKKVIFIPKITIPFEFSSQKSKKKLVIFFSDFSHGFTQLYNKAFLQSRGPDSREKDSRMAFRADCSHQRQARQHTVGFGLAEGQRPDGQPMCGVAEGQATLRYPSHES